MRPPIAWAAAVAVVAAGMLLLGAVGCASLDRPSAQGERVALPTPLRTYGASVAATVSQLQAAVAAAGSRLDAANMPYRPSEPQSLLQVPRVVMRADLADPDDGFVVIYEASGDASAASLADDFVRYLESGLGQTNYPADTQFSVAVLGDTLVFTSRSASRSSDPAMAEAVFDAMASVGEAVEVRR